MKFKCSIQSDNKISKEIDTNTNKRISSLNIPVEISEVMYLHGDKCHPGPDSQRYAKKNSGRYLMKENITKDSITLFNSGHIPSTTIREYIRHLCRVPTGVELSSSDLHNFKVRVNDHGRKILLSMKEQNRKKLWTSEPLDESERSIFGKLDNISESCSQLFQELRSMESNEHNKLLQLLNGLKNKNNYFQYSVSYSRTKDKGKAITGVVWMTEE